MKLNNFRNLLLLFFITVTTGLLAQISDNFNIDSTKIKILKENGYDKIEVDDLSAANEIGNPKLPVKVQLFVIPYHSEFKGITINSLEKHKLSGSYNIIPCQSPYYDIQEESNSFYLPNIEIYSSDNAYPGKYVEFISDGYLYGYHVIEVKIYPFKYLPKSGSLYKCDINYTIEYSIAESDKDIKNLFKQSKYRSQLTQKYVSSTVKNSSDIVKFAYNYSDNSNTIENYTTTKTSESTSMSDLSLPDITEEVVPDYIIITNNALKPTFQNLADWKTKKGIPTIIETVEEISLNYPGCDLPEKIRNYLKECSSNDKWGPGLFVLLGGDSDIIPSRELLGVCIDKAPVDFYYSTIEGTWNADKDDIFAEDYTGHKDSVDWTPDLFLGRAPVENITETQIFINKVIDYELYSNLGTSTYVNNILYLIGFLGENSCGVYSESIAGQVKDICLPFIPEIKNNCFALDNYNCLYNSADPYTTPYAYMPYQYGYCNPSNPSKSERIPGGGTCVSGDVLLNKSNALSLLNTGGSYGKGNFHIIFHMMHSGIRGMGVSLETGESFKFQDFDNLSNGNYGQIMFSGGCKPAVFTSDCIAEHYLNNPNGGGVAFIGNADCGSPSQ